jgi:hypothetical protein
MRRSISFQAAAVSMALLAVPIAPGSSRSQERPSEVVVLSTLHQLHDSAPGYSFEDLADILRELEPTVLAVELSAADLQSRKEQTVKQEYQRSVYPVADELELPLRPMEPSEPLYSELVQLHRNSVVEVSEARTELHEAFGELVGSAMDVLLAKWDSPSAAQQPLTDELFAAKHRLQDIVYGPDQAESWRRWNEHFLSRILAAAAEFPGGRVVVTVGAEHGYWLRSALAELDEVRLLSLEEALGAPSGA